MDGHIAVFQAYLVEEWKRGERRKRVIPVLAYIVAHIAQHTSHTACCPTPPFSPLPRVPTQAAPSPPSQHTVQHTPHHTVQHTVQGSILLSATYRHRPLLRRRFKLPCRNRSVGSVISSPRGHRRSFNRPTSRNRDNSDGDSPPAILDPEPTRTRTNILRNPPIEHRRVRLEVRRPMCSWMSYEALPAFDDESQLSTVVEKNLSVPGVRT